MKLNIVIPILLLFVGCATYRTSTTDKYALYMDGVTTEMTVAEHWLKPHTHPDKVIMSESEISEWFKTPEKAFDTISMAGFADSEYFSRWIHLFGQRRSLFDANGSPIDSCHWDQAIANMNPDGFTGKIKYAITVNKTEERVLPTSERGYQDSDNAFFDDLIMTVLLPNEQVVVLHTSLDGKWYFVLGKYAPAGWVRTEDIAFCENKEKWAETQTGDFLIVTADRIRLDIDEPDGKEFTELTMGTKLRLIDSDFLKEDYGPRIAKNVYPVALPKRREDGTLGHKTVFLPAREGVHVGYLPYTSRNVLELAFSCLGDRYGWGGTFEARDCSSFIQDIYRCFGILLPRNSRMQAAFQGKTWNLEDMKAEQKINLIKKEAIPGSLLFMPGHVFMYLGEENGKIYTINSASSFMIDGKKTYVQSVVINSLDVLRGNGKTWLESATNLKTYEKDN